MEEFYINTITFISGLDPLVKGLIIGLLFILVIFCARNIIKTHVNPKKTIFKFGQFFILAILIAITVFISIHAF